MNGFREKRFFVEFEDGEKRYFNNELEKRKFETLNKKIKEMEWTNFSNDFTSSPKPFKITGIMTVNQMEENKQLDSSLVQLARLALSGRRQDIELFIRRLIHNNGLSSDAAKKLTRLLQDSPTKTSPFRNAALPALPVDTDSRLQLLRQEFPAIVDQEPIWAPNVRTKLEQIIQEREKEANLIRAGIQPSRSLLFTGEPGVGKSLAARWLAMKLQLPLLILDLSAVMSSFLGRTGANVRNVIDYAKGTRAILLLDEFDAIAKRRDDAVEVGELKRLVTVLLQEIDDWPPTGILIAATNHSNLLDPAVWRRFDLIVEFPMPTEEQVGEKIEKVFKPESELPKEWVDILRLLLTGSSFAEIERELLAIRRRAIISQSPYQDLITEFVKGKTQHLRNKARVNIAQRLIELGYSQRRAHEWTDIRRQIQAVHFRKVNKMKGKGKKGKKGC